MVHLSRLLYMGKDRYRAHYGKFIDSLRIYIRGGAGGMGLPRYGGIGGKGGNIVLCATKGATLKSLVTSTPTKRYIAGNGGNSNKNMLLGEPGHDVTIPVPVGITVMNDSKQILGELNEEGGTLLVAHGAAGGSPASQFSGMSAEPFSITLDLKLIADVGLVGFPNAGKSTLLGAISRARPKVASYPFTTIRPIVGLLSFPDHRQISMADLPGLIEGAHMNVGLGHKFLKHVERTKLLLLVSDIEGFQLGPQYPLRSCLDTVVLLNKEIELYRDDLLDKPVMLLVNKMDLKGAQFKFDEIKDKLKHLADVVSDYPEELRPERVLNFSDIMHLSAKMDPNGVERLKYRIREILDFHALQEQKDKEMEEISKLRIQMLPRGPQML